MVNYNGKFVIRS